METTTSSVISPVSDLRRFFESGATLSYSFRLRQLVAFRTALEAHEEDIYNALYHDLRKSKTEAFLTEFGLLLSETKTAIKRLRSWMRPERVITNLLNIPSASRLHPHPKGVVLIIGAWNYPLLLGLVPVVGAIAGGNCVVIKPSEHAAATAAVIGSIFKNSFPENYIRVVQGEGAGVVPDLMNAIRFDHVFYTGSGTVGRSVYELAAQKLVPVTLELGGKSPAIVEKDAALAVSARRIIFGKFINAGQTCVAPDYLLVHADIHDRFLEVLKESITAFFGTEVQSSPDYGRIINRRRFDALITLLENSAGRVVTGGTYDAADRFIAPTILKDITATDALMQEELFGPLLPVLSFRTREEAAAIVEQHKNPLAFYLFTTSKRTEREWLDRTAFGNGCVNNTIQHLANAHLPFGGVGQSGIGAYRGIHSFKLFTHARAVMKTPVWFDPPVKYPPYGDKLKWLKRIF
ncbi:aldehyde dehydrogenase [Niabella beijingensis]|uniref:aldehyde dehydrogenase n=1 Tax=Niabella beijingensis TaxID=2872700 RepID=UPI0021D4063E|nr:aldehyde dehydrogenase [Niabella beijingensis]MBZ4191808.1 aldehyde dehydrogenase [Niabella beijingensis]